MSIPGLLLGGLGAAAVGSAYSRLGDIGDTAFDKSKIIGDQAVKDSAFKGYTVASSLGNTKIGSAGGANLQLGGVQQAQQDQFGQGALDAFGRAADPTQYNQLQSQLSQLLGGVGGNPQSAQGIQGIQDGAFNLSGMMMDATGQDTGEREQQIFDRIRAMQSPDEQRQRMLLGDQLQNQGRLGLRTSMFGGTPEQFSMDQAQAEARNQAALMAMQQAQAQQAQQAGIANQFGNLGFAGAGLQQQLASQGINDFSSLAGLGSGLQGQQASMGQAMLQGQYLPQSALLQQGQLGLQNANISQQAKSHGASLKNEANMGGLEAQLASALGQANLMGNVGTGLLTGLASNIGPSKGNSFSQGLEALWAKDPAKLAEAIAANPTAFGIK